MNSHTSSIWQRPWVHSAWVDGLFILLPGLASVIVVLLAHALGVPLQGVSTGLWVLLIVCVDVAHVYSTLYRTYFDAHERAQRGRLLQLIPLVGFTLGVLLYSYDAMAFWRALAYVAVFHFVRQQYGFLRVYARHEQQLPVWFRRVDALAIYAATLYPLLYWHTHARPFHWFVAGDFFALPAWLHLPGLVVYVGILAAWVTKECISMLRYRYLNLPKCLLVIGTALAWYVGIVALAGDLAFTATNVITHGIPYMALIWAYGRKKQAKNNVTQPSSFNWFSTAALPLFVGLLLLLAFVEEGLWDALVWRDHPEVFAWFAGLPQLVTHDWLSWVVPLLTLPQLTHYILDGFIWKLDRRPTEPQLHFK